MRLAVLGLLLSGTALADNCKLISGGAFVPQYAVMHDERVGDGPYIAIYEVAPKNDRERKEACAKLYEAHFASVRRVFWLLGGGGDDAFEHAFLQVRYPDRASEKDFPNHGLKVAFEYEGEGKKRSGHITIDATLEGGACHVETPVVICR